MILAEAFEADVAVMAHTACSLRFQGPGLMKETTDIQNGIFSSPFLPAHRAFSRSPRGRNAAHALPAKYAMRTIKVPEIVTDVGLN